MKKIFLTFLCLFSIFIILSYPTTVNDGVCQGIKLALYSVIPSLLPFMVLTNIMIKYNLCEYISFIFYPILNKFFKISTMGCFAIIIGFTCGYPMGAKIVGDLYRNKLITSSEASYLITFCNNCSISFLLNYIVFECLGLEMPIYKILLLIYFPPIIAGILNKFILKPNINIYIKESNIYKNINPLINALKSISILSIYIICFTVISNCISNIHIIPIELKSIISGITEISSGASFISKTIHNHNRKIFLILCCTVFGGFSIMFQSFEQLSDKYIKKNYVLGKLEQLIIFCILYVLFAYL